jgi:formylmethanofuran dehydrogenase subunit B
MSRAKAVFCQICAKFCCDWEIASGENAMSKNCNACHDQRRRVKRYIHKAAYLLKNNAVD